MDIVFSKTLPSLSCSHSDCFKNEHRVSGKLLFPLKSNCTVHCNFFSIDKMNSSLIVCSLAKSTTPKITFAGISVMSKMSVMSKLPEKKQSLVAPLYYDCHSERGHSHSERSVGRR